MSWAGCYSLVLYCDKAVAWPDPLHEWNEFPHQYTNEFGRVARAEARRAGWIIRNDGTAICPKCSGKQRKEKS